MAEQKKNLSTGLLILRAASFLFYFLFSLLKSEVIHGNFEKLGLDECVGLYKPCKAWLVWGYLQGELRSAGSSSGEEGEKEDDNMSHRSVSLLEEVFHVAIA